MVTTGIINLGYAILTWILSLFGAYTGLPTGLTNALAWIGGVGAGISCIVPVDTYKTQIQIIMGIAVVLLFVRFFAWIFNRNMKHPDHA